MEHICDKGENFSFWISEVLFLSSNIEGVFENFWKDKICSSCNWGGDIELSKLKSNIDESIFEFKLISYFDVLFDVNFDLDFISDNKFFSFVLLLESDIIFFFRLFLYILVSFDFDIFFVQLFPLCFHYLNHFLLLIYLHFYSILLFHFYSLFFHFL